MSGSVKGSRRAYRSPVRAEQAENTRRRAVDAAARLFVERGYAGTTVTGVAAAAGISPETIYGSLGGKRGLLERVIEDAISGPEGAAVEHQRWQLEVGQLPTPHARLVGWVEVSCRTLARTSPVHAVIRGAADREAFAVTLRERLLQRRLAQVTDLAGQYLGPALRTGVSVPEAGLRYAGLVSPETYHLFTVELGWSPPHLRDWLTQVLVADLLDPRAETQPRPADGVEEN
ncbi:TetR/AcrR family transcriptional regulator [Pseudonocardia saturnea]